MNETKKAFRNLQKKNDLQAAANILCNLKGIGPAMASGELSCSLEKTDLSTSQTWQHSYFQKKIWGVPSKKNLYDVKKNVYMCRYNDVNKPKNNSNYSAGNFSPNLPILCESIHQRPYKRRAARLSGSCPISSKPSRP
jgi:hypothetical protein